MADCPGCDESLGKGLGDGVDWRLLSDGGKEEIESEADWVIYTA